MNTRGLTELIVLNIALEKGVISEALFASLVIMALVTTLMAGPILRLLDPKKRIRGASRRGARPRQTGIRGRTAKPGYSRSLDSAGAEIRTRASPSLLAIGEPLGRA